MSSSQDAPTAGQGITTLRLWVSLGGAHGTIYGIWDAAELDIGGTELSSEVSVSSGAPIV
ncbi:MAG: hypothetical protein LBJ61_08750 [Deltaproteobacteria bacterium]|nr:hypothetical protein [Deltaproteobacteria bacterium]